MASSAAAGLLSRQLKQMQSDKDIPGISCGLVNDNVFEWEVMLMISDECRFYGGMYRRLVSFRYILIEYIEDPSADDWLRRILPCASYLSP